MSNYTLVFSFSISFHTAVIMPLTYVLFFISIPILSPVLKYHRAAAYSLSCWFLMYKEINFFSNCVHSPGIVPVMKAIESAFRYNLNLTLLSREERKKEIDLSPASARWGWSCQVPPDLPAYLNYLSHLFMIFVHLPLCSINRAQYNTVLKKHKNSNLK